MVVYGKESSLVWAELLGMIDMLFLGSTAILAVMFLIETWAFLFRQQATL